MRKQFDGMSTEAIIKLQKRSAIGRTIGSVLAVFVVAASVIAVLLQILPVITAFTFVFVGILLLRLMSRMTKLRFGKIELVLLDDCDCDKYIQIYQALREKKPEKSGLDTISIAKGYFFKGDFEAAKKELLSIPREQIKGNVWIPYYNVAMQNYLELGELQHAREIRQEIEKYAANQKSGSPLAKLVAQLEKYADFADAFRRKDYETARGLQDDIRKLSDHAAQLSLLYYRMGVMEIEAGQMEEAREHLEYVKQYAGQVFVRPEAERLLEELDAQDIGAESAEDAENAENAE